MFVTHSIAPTDSTARNPKNEATIHKRATVESVLPRLKLPKLSRETPCPSSGSRGVASSAAASAISPACSPKRQLEFHTQPIHHHPPIHQNPSPPYTTQKNNAKTR